MIRVGVNGYGTIGRRVADAIRAQPDMRVEGVAKRGVDAGGTPRFVAGSTCTPRRPTGSRRSTPRDSTLPGRSRRWSGRATWCFNARSNYGSARGAASLRVVSCNSTALSRLATPLEEGFGIDRMRATLVRRGGDPDQPDRGPIDDIVPDPVTVPS
jgi:glyceraldehyde-3-phosphate dehydrogenase (NAD(P))